jgi:hypothetical protein
VVLIAVLFSLCCRNFDLNEDEDMEDDEFDPMTVEDADSWPPNAGTNVIISYNQGCQIFWSKREKNIPNDRKLYQTAINYTKWP